MKPTNSDPSDIDYKDESFSTVSGDVQSNELHVSHSGNAEVDVKVDVHVDVTPIAFAMLYSLLANNSLTDEG
ncbi:MAG: hypothetical protein ACI35R_04470, partial [Bacillus sp. (in: firmicutes)]